MVNARRLAVIFACLSLFGLAMIHLFGGKIPSFGLYSFQFSWICSMMAILSLALSLRKMK